MSRGAQKGANTRMRRRLLLVGWTLASCVILASAGVVQLKQGRHWQAAADRQQQMSVTIPAPRGLILDRDEVALAVSTQAFRISVAPQELRDEDEVQALLERVLGLSSRKAKSVVASDRLWIVLPGRFTAADREALRGVQGVYAELTLRRDYPHRELARGILGVVRDGTGAGGIEQGMDSILTGAMGQEIMARDSRGDLIPGEAWVLEQARPGASVVLTIDLDLQEIAHGALTEAVEQTGAKGGDLLITDPKSGEILAMTSVREGDEWGLSGINTPYEPGSTLKPFTVAAILRHGLLSLSDSVDTGNGEWTVEGRTVHDTHPIGKATVADALRESSNVGIAMAAQGLTPAQQYENLRDFGFGGLTGISLPGEASGLLRRPDRWSKQSPASLAFGYEISVTPIQMAMAYGALANGGVLMEPKIVREIRSADGDVLQSFPDRVVRRVASREVARSINEVLAQVVEDGTGTRARLTGFRVAGKSGTSRAYQASTGRYEAGAYYASFIGFFPVEDPQLVVFVKLESPVGTYYGGATAAPVTRATMEAVLAAHRPPVDRRALARVARRIRAPELGVARLVSNPILPPSSNRLDAERLLASGDGVPVPEIAGASPRSAARRLHALGLRVIWNEPGTVVGTNPQAGVRLSLGDTVRLVTRGGQDD